MLGSFEVHTDDGVVADVPGARLRGLLIALALEPGRTVPKARLVDWIWGEYPPAETANALQRLVSRLRKALPEGAIEGQPGGYRLTVEPDAVDAVRFERLVAQAGNDEGPRRVHLLREALTLWRGAAMQDVGLQESAAFDAAVARLDGLRLTAMEDRFDAEVSLGNGAELVTELTDLVAAHPVRERLVAALMRALAAAGRGNEALLVFQRTREALADELGADPSPDLSALHVALLRGDYGRREEPRRTNLRAELTSFVGKDADVAAVRELVAGHRLTTLIGPGGSGKTRLATETGRRLLGTMPDGAWLVELAAIDADGDVAQSTIATLGLRDALLGGAPHTEMTDRLVAAIRDREALLILDNCEHVIESAAIFAHRVLGECRRLRILATSREPLGITGEALWRVEPLAVPEASAGPGDIASSPAVRLLRDRAGAVRKDLGADAPTLATMMRVCRALDGMPPSGSAPATGWTRSRCSNCSPPWRKSRCCSPTGGARRATGCWAPSRSTPASGSRRRGSPMWPVGRIWPTSPNSPRPRSRVFAAPNNWNGSPGSMSNATTSVRRCAVRSRPARRSRRCGSRWAPAGTGGWAGTRPKASS